MIRVPGQNPQPIPSSHIQPPKEANSDEKKAQDTTERPAAPLVGKSSIGRGPELDSQAIAVRLAVLATEAKKKEIDAEEFERILQEVINLTGLEEPQAAMEEASKKLQHEIEIELQKIKDNKDLMEEAEDWQSFAEVLANLSEGQAEAILTMMHEEIKAL
ncbi:hypothetical protein COT42_03230 [Candidatus Saganbacteria bacterium CG08_land_8_20_14_0_20_45_16]|uniref:Uncharacterized protein n=1 Tax=Candidatus Saganbacteria bacterium CG08_land_8_20_14_0_20_45_16 TaxID=2014293 RepID=A0A2H0Y193_UNCSA|nr:MAG: hypothetical protein COT42_03230 [Candidatus Saganbacteria bacterium CG08_land_8_20_14_0_20_45_16]